MKQIGPIEISLVSSGGITFLPLLTYLSNHSGHTVEFGWIRWGITIWWPLKKYWKKI